MTQLVYTREELMRSHDYAAPHTVDGHRLHGGFDAAGCYVPPRALIREPAMRAWTDALRSRGGEPMEADSSVLLGGVRLPNEAQQKLLLLEGLGQSFWNTLTITGEIEGQRSCYCINTATMGELREKFGFLFGSLENCC